MRKISLIFTFALIFLGVAQIKAETLTADFNSGLPEGWSLVGNLTNDDTRARSGKGIWTSSKSTTDNYVITEAVQGTFEFYARAYNKSYASTVVVYEYTGSGLGKQLYTTGSMYTSSTPSWSKYSFTISSGTQLAIVLNYAAIDDVTYTQYEAPTGAALNVLVDGSKVDYNYNFDFGVTTSGATKTFTMKNPGGEDLDVTVAADGGFGVNPTTATIASKGEVEVTVTMPDASAEGSITITPSEASGLESFILHASGQIVPVMEVYLDETAIVAGFADKFGKVTENVTHTYTVKNTGTAALNVAIASDNTEFTVNPANLEVAVDGEATFEVTFNYNAENVGARNASITLTPADTYNTALTFTATANVADPNVWSEDFEANVIPEGWESTNESYWNVSDGVAHGQYAYGSTKYYLTTPALEVKAGEELTFNYKRKNATMVIEMQMNGDGNWTTLEAGGSYTTDSEWQTYTISGLEAGIYQFRFANDDYDLDNFEGFKLATLAHNVAITSFNIPTVGYTGDEFVATVTLQEKAGVDEPMWAKLYINGNVVAEANKEVLANTEETLTLTFIPTQAAAYGSKAYIEVYNTNKDFTKKTDEQSVYIQEVSVLEISETTTNTFESGTWDRVKMDYTVREGWNTIALPFIVNDLTVFGESVKAWAFTGYDGNLKFSKVTGSLAAATPYILYVENPTEGKVVFQNVTIYGTSASEEDCKVTQGAATFQGTYSRMMAGEMKGKYGVTPDGEIRVGSAIATMKAFRAYFILPEGSEGAKLVIEGVNDEATAIDAAEVFDNQDGDIYDLSGRKVSHAQKGIYIQNGKKVVIK
ncbi:MAG: hypothetical protein IIZ97_09425 [Prevotella sp.]|nr:hypothetical protein [Prevotella sp.]